MARNRAPEEATTPRMLSGSAKRAVREATTRSQASAISKPPPNAGPSTAAMSGLARRRLITPYSPPRSVRPLPSFKSVPAENTAVVPVMTPAHSSSSSSSRFSASSMPSAVARSMALRLASRSMRTTRTRLRRSQRTVAPADGTSEEQVDDRLGLQVVLEQVLGGALHVRAPVLLGARRVPGLDQADELRVGPDDPLEALVSVVVVALRDLGAQVGGDDVLQHGPMDGHGLVAAALQDQLVEPVGQGGPDIGVRDKRLLGGDLGLELVHNLGQLLEVLVGAVQREQPGARRLGDHPGLVDVVDGGALHL